MPGTPRYEKLKNLLRDKITSGKYQPGERFYSQNELMAKYGLSFSTVTRALDELEREGYVARKRGKGTFVEAVHTLKREPLQVHKRAYLFAPLSPDQSLLSYSAHVYKHLELLDFEAITLKFVPHGTQPDDLEPFLFKLEPTDTAVFLYPVEAHLEFIRMLAISQPVLVVSYAPVDHGCPSIVTPLTRASEIATRHLLQLGHERIAFVGDDSQSRTQALLDGYRGALRQAGFSYRDSLVSRGASAENAGALADIFARSTDGDFTAIFAASTVMALSVLSELRVMGEQPGMATPVICYDDLERTGSINPGTSTVAFPGKAVALEILQAIVGDGSDPSLRTITMEPVLTAGLPAPIPDPLRY